MVSFGTFFRILEDYGKTAYYTWRAVDRSSSQRLHRFAQDLIKNGYLPTPQMYMDDLHMSIIRTENELMNYVPDKRGVAVLPVRWALLGKNPNYYLCLITQIPDRVMDQIAHARKEKAQFVFENFLPHISLMRFRTNQIDFEGLPLPKFQIHLEGEERHHFNEFL